MVLLTTIHDQKSNRDKGKRCNEQPLYSRSPLFKSPLRWFASFVTSSLLLFFVFFFCRPNGPIYRNDLATKHPLESDLSERFSQWSVLLLKRISGVFGNYYQIGPRFVCVNLVVSFSSFYRICGRN